MKTFFTVISFLGAVLFCGNLQAQSWSYAKQGTPTWMGASAKDIYVDATGSVSLGEIGLIDIFEGEVYVVKHDLSGNVLWENSFDHSGTIEITERIAPVPSDGGFLLSSILADGYRPWIIKTDASGNLVWSSEAWSDLLPENSGSQVYAYQLPDDNIAVVAPRDVEKKVYFYTVDNATGALISTTTVDYNEVMPGCIIGTACDITSDPGGNSLIAFNFVCTDSLPAALARFSSSFTLEMSQLCGATGVAYPMQIEVITGGFGYYVVGSQNTGGFFGDVWSPYICLVDYGGTFYGSNSFPGALYNSTGYGLTTVGSELRMIRYNFSGDSYGDSPGDYMEIVTIPEWYDPETAAKTINYAPYNTLEVIKPYNDGYIVGGTFWEIGLPSYFTIIASDDLENLPECIFNCVWPGDADNSGLTDMDDLLAIGLGYAATGASRAGATIDWTGQNAEEWATALPDGTNHKYTDCNGDGIINDDDTTAVSINYSFDHAVNTLRTDAGDIPLSFVTDGSATIGLNTIPIVLGDAVNMVEEIYGIRFNVVVDGENIEPGSIKINFNDSWMLDADNYLQLTKNNGIDLNADGGAVRTDNTNASGYGEIGTLSFVVIDNIAGKGEAEDIEYSFENIRAINLEGEDLSVVGVSSTETNPTAINELNNIVFTISPNPTSNYFYLQTNNSVENISIFNITGNKLMELKNTISELNYFDVNELPAGQYLVEVISEGNVFTQKLMIIK
ncbi:MAG: T9SS type A sorting domain-containing protein [Bacteroidetes bacterium]|nr:T9SS type A sorting domain-containing protein [Bacteroidota bacterium]